MFNNFSNLEKSPSTSENNEAKHTDKSLLQVPFLKIREGSRSFKKIHKRSDTTRNKSEDNALKTKLKNEVDENAQYRIFLKDEFKYESNSYSSSSSNSFINFFRSGMNASKKRMSHENKNNHEKSLKSMIQATLKNSKTQENIASTAVCDSNNGLPNKSTTDSDATDSFLFSSIIKSTNKISLNNLVSFPNLFNSISESISTESNLSDSFEQIMKINLNRVNTNTKVSI